MFSAAQDFALPESSLAGVPSQTGADFQKHPQSILLTNSIVPRLQEIHPDGYYYIGQDCGIYWRLTQPPEKGAAAPDWFYVPNVPPTLNGELRRSYVFWQELIAPLMVLELVSGDGEEERDKTPYQGKFWIYENIIRPPYYGIYQFNNASLEVYQLVANHYEKVRANSRGHYLIAPMGVELGIWHGRFMLDQELPWLRWWDELGDLLLTGDERVEAERQRAESERQRAESERLRVAAVEQENQRLRIRLRALGVDPDSIG